MNNVQVGVCCHWMNSSVLWSCICYSSIEWLCMLHPETYIWKAPSKHIWLHLCEAWTCDGTNGSGGIPIIALCHLLARDTCDGTNNLGKSGYRPVSSVACVVSNRGRLLLSRGGYVTRWWYFLLLISVFIYLNKYLSFLSSLNWLFYPEYSWYKLGPLHGQWRQPLGHWTGGLSEPLNWHWRVEWRWCRILCWATIEWIPQSVCPDMDTH